MADGTSAQTGEAALLGSKLTQIAKQPEPRLVGLLTHEASILRCYVSICGVSGCRGFDSGERYSMYPRQAGLIFPMEFSGS
jgi:hypothetical protein